MSVMWSRCTSRAEDVMLGPEESTWGGRGGVFVALLGAKGVSCELVETDEQKKEKKKKVNCWREGKNIILPRTHPQYAHTDPLAET